MLTRMRKAFYRVRGHCVADLAGEPFRCDPYHSKFWRKASRGGWEPETFAILDRHLAPDRDHLDIGAWIGPTVLYASRKARHVWAFEPDPAAFRALGWNLELNGVDNVSALPAALSGATGLARMAPFSGEAGDSTTSLLNPDGEGGGEVLTLGWQDFEDRTDLDRVSLVKMDVEGGEFDLLPNLVPWLLRQRPALLLSLHGPYLPEDTRRQRMAALTGALSGYGNWHDAENRRIAPEDLLSDAALARFQTVLLTP